MTFFKEFKEFAIKGNMMDMAIGIIIGAAFNKVVDVLVKQVFLPPLTLMSNGIKFSSYKFVLQPAKLDANGEVVQEAVAIGYGALIEASIDFLIIGLTVFLVVKGMNRLRNRADDVKDTSVETPKNIQLLDSISELLQKQNDILKDK